MTSAPVSIKKGTLMVVPSEVLQREQLPHTTGGLSHFTAKATLGSCPQGVVLAGSEVGMDSAGPLAGPQSL